MRHGTQHADVATAELETALRGGPFHVALRAAITARGLPLQRVQHHLSRYGVKVGVTSLSYWQQGARRPQRPESLRAVRALEEILQLPDESLIRLLAKAEEHAGPQRPAGRSYRSLVEASSVLERLLAELDSPLDGGLHTIGHHERVRIGADRELLGRESHHIVRAHKDGVDRYMAIHHGDTGVLVAELLFDIRLRAGDTFLFRYDFEDGTAGSSSEYVRGFGFAGGQYALQVHFAENALPVRCHRFTQHSAAAPRGGRQELALSGRHHSVHLVEPRVRSGIVGIGWDWE
jgi:hypothetical protein